MDYQLLALDVDGTTVIDGGAPTPRVVQAVAAAQAHGVRVALATGRAFAPARGFATALGIYGPLICFQGALVKEQAGSQATLLADTLPLEPLADVIDFAAREGLEFSIYTDTELFYQCQRHDQAYYDLWFSFPSRRVPDLAAAVRDFVAQGRPLIKGLFIGEPAELDTLTVRLGQLLHGRLEILRSHTNFLEVAGPGVSKARGLAVLAARAGVPREKVIAVGDSGNDIAMIRWAGLGVAVANAAAEVLAAADWIAPSVEQDGVAVVIEKFVLADGRGT